LQSKIFAVFLVTVLSFQSFLVLPTFSATRSFDQNQILYPDELSKMPKSFNSANKIQEYLESEGSVLATYQAPINFEPDDIIISPNVFQNLPQFLQPRYALAPYYGKTMRVSDFIWELSRGDAGNGCSLGNYNVCINNRVQPLNPVFILAKIQKENGLVRGSCAQVGAVCYGQSMQFRLDRAAGYMCTGGATTSSCYDENPNWKYFKGFFRQIYYAMRLLRLYQQYCDANGVSVGGTLHKTGNTYTVQNGTADLSTSQVVYQNGITCALYVYTPYISAQSLLFNVLNSMDFNLNLMDKLPEGEIEIPVPATDAQ